MALINCPECGKEVSDKVKACPHCGFPFSEEAQTQRVEVIGVKLRNRNFKKPLVIVVSIMVVIITSVFGVRLIKEQNAQLAYKESFNEYVDNLEMVQLLMLTGASDAESLCILTAKVWRNAIYKERDSETDDYTRPWGFFVSDFNTALTNLYAASSTISTVTKIKSNQNDVRDLTRHSRNQ